MIAEYGRVRFGGIVRGPSPITPGYVVRDVCVSVSITYASFGPCARALAEPEVPGGVDEHVTAFAFRGVVNRAWLEPVALTAI